VAVIGFSDDPENVWCVAGWAFRQVLEDVLARNPYDQEMAEAFFIAETQSGLHIDLLEPPLAARVTSAIRDVAEGILSKEVHSGIFDKPYSNAETVEQYRKGLQQLLEAFPRISN
jgi:hypothetical protein